MISLHISTGFPPIGITHNFAKSKTTTTPNFFQNGYYTMNTREHFLDCNLNWSREETL